MIILEKSTPNRILSQLSFSKPVITDDFHCHCTSDRCTRTLIKDDIPNKVAIIKKNFTPDIIMTSAYRCQFHNESVGGVEDSYHLIGHAVDLFPIGGNVDELYAIMSLYFDVVIKYDTFVHGHDLIRGEHS